MKKKDGVKGVKKRAKKKKTAKKKAHEEKARLYESVSWQRGGINE